MQSNKNIVSKWRSCIENVILALKNIQKKWMVALKDWGKIIGQLSSILKEE